MLNRNFCSKDNEKAVQYLCDKLPFKVNKYSNGEVRNGWVIPPMWNLIEAKILKAGNVVYDGTDHPLKVISLSSPVNSKISGSELRKHLHYKTVFETGSDAIPFHFKQNYRCWDRSWGFCVSQDFYNSIDDDEYEVIIETEEKEGFLTVLEYEKKGRTQDCFFFVAHLDHPGMANDDLAGCAVGVELMKRLEDIDTKFTYKLLIVPEIIGSEYYLSQISETERELALGGLFLEALGSETNFSLQSSVATNSIVEKLLSEILNARKLEFQTGLFGTIIGNDEIVFEAYQIPMPSLSRYPFNEYHTNKDSIQIMSKSCLNESVDIVQELVNKLEQVSIYHKNFEGIVCLSHPDYDLHIDDIYNGEKTEGEMGELRTLMDGLHFKKNRFLLDEFMSQFDHLSEEDVVRYLGMWEQRGLLEQVQ